MGFGTLEHQFWEHEELRALGLECRTVAAYLLTSRHSTTEGLFRLPAAYAVYDLGVEMPVFTTYMRALDLVEFARYDEDSQVVFIRNAMRFKPPRGPKSIAGALTKVAGLPLNPFRSLFYDAACAFAPEFGVALAQAGWASAQPTREVSLFEQHVAEQAASAPPPPRPGPAPLALTVGSDGDRLETILQLAATISVQRSVMAGEAIRNHAAVASSRLGKHRAEWAPLVAGWLGYFDTDDRAMADAIVDGGTAKPHWPRLATSS